MKGRLQPHPDRRVVIPLRVESGRLVPFYGGEMPRLREGTIVEMVTQVSAFEDLVEAERFELDEIVEILPADSQLFAIMSLHLESVQGGALPRVDVKPIPPPGGECYLIPFHTTEPIRLHLRGTKPAELLPCKCAVAIKIHEQPKSINEAYSRLSEHYEPWRRSHTGNVFDQVYFTRDGMEAYPLRVLRDEAEATAETKLFLKSGELPLRKRAASDKRGKR